MAQVAGLVLQVPPEVERLRVPLPEVLEVQEALAEEA